MVKEIDVLTLPLCPECLLKSVKCDRLVITNSNKPAVCKDGPLCLGWTPGLRFLLDADPSILQSSPDGESVIEAVLMLVRRNCAPLLVSDSKDLQDRNLDHTAFECLNDILGSTNSHKIAIRMLKGTRT